MTPIWSKKPTFNSGSGPNPHRFSGWLSKPKLRSTFVALVVWASYHRRLDNALDLFREAFLAKVVRWLAGLTLRLYRVHKNARSKFVQTVARGLLVPTLAVYQFSFECAHLCFLCLFFGRNGRDLKTEPGDVIVKVTHCFVDPYSNIDVVNGFRGLSDPAHSSGKVVQNRDSHRDAGQPAQSSSPVNASQSL